MQKLAAMCRQLLHNHILLYTPPFFLPTLVFFALADFLFLSSPVFRRYNRSI
ncbi:hypothetical protein Krac_12328 [Ktedonobacter racemifer DSM 44963]|uniref:Uncharacterized protein n=1 Tax=Ktedonobacter racemifer DSM 44963 TaxID=485913 RepID=D6TGI3_KTERA|nr:hypothetical protein Krac_12328 [Ktedonobacter racemifer DSM 44963]